MTRSQFLGLLIPSFLVNIFNKEKLSPKINQLYSVGIDPIRQGSPSGHGILCQIKYIPSEESNETPYELAEIVWETHEKKNVIIRKVK